MDQHALAAPGAGTVSVTEDIVAAAWANALRRPTVDRDADFRALGVNANRALGLMREIWSETGRELPINALLEWPTIRRLAAAIDDGSAFIAADIVRLRASGDDGAPPLYFFGGGGGYLVDLADLAAALDIEGCVYGIPAAGMDGRGAPLERYEDEARNARDVIKRTQPDGPYRLIGYSNGGLAALETARLMRGDGDEVAFLGMLDTGLDDKYWPLPVWLAFVTRKAAANLAETLRAIRKRAPGQPRLLAQPSAARLLDISPRRRGNQYTYRFRDPSNPNFPYYSPYYNPCWEARQTPLYSRVRKAAAHMKGRYRPSRYEGRVHFFKATTVDRLTVDPRLLWPPYLPDVEWVILPGNHLTIIFSRHAARLATEIAKRL